MSPHRWLTVQIKGDYPRPLAYHTCSLILNPERYRAGGLITLTSLPEFRSFNRTIELEGIYFFGGRDKRGATNRLWVLRIGMKPCEWVQPSIDGVPPLPRYGHSMCHYPKKNILIVFGGRNDMQYLETRTDCLDDVWILSLDRLQWTKWDKPEMGSVPLARYSHSSAVISSFILIFGGLSEYNYCKSEVYSIDMEKAFGFESIREKLSKNKLKLSKEIRNTPISINVYSRESVCEKELSIPDHIEPENAQQKNDSSSIFSAKEFNTPKVSVIPPSSSTKRISVNQLIEEEQEDEEIIERHNLHSGSVADI